MAGSDTSNSDWNSKSRRSVAVGGSAVDYLADNYFGNLTCHVFYHRYRCGF